MEIGWRFIVPQQGPTLPPYGLCLVNLQHFPRGKEEHHQWEDRKRPFTSSLFPLPEQRHPQRSGTLHIRWSLAWLRRQLWENQSRADGGSQDHHSTCAWLLASAYIHPQKPDIWKCFCFSPSQETNLSHSSAIPWQVNNWDGSEEFCAEKAF